MRVGYRCSNPACRRPTVGPAAGSQKPSVLGEAAHITAASTGGARYDESLTSDERKNISNGIWLCRMHARQIDVDSDTFTVDVLHEWKRRAEESAFIELSTGEIAIPQLLQKVNLAVSQYDEAPALEPERIELLAGRVAMAANSDIRRFKSLPGWPRRIISSNLRNHDIQFPTFDVAGCAAALNASRELTIVARPGVGKTTFCVQLAEEITRQVGKIGVFVPLGEWIGRSETIFRSLRWRQAFSTFSEEDFHSLAVHGRLAIILDGWNELSPFGRRTAVSELKRLRRDFPLLEIVVSTRLQTAKPPISGPTIEVEPFSEEQQLELVSALAGEIAERLLEEAWRTEGLRELVSNPLYLTAVASYASIGSLPKSKEEVLHLLVDQHEQAVEGSEALAVGLYGLHKQVLTALAVEATSLCTTTLSEQEARLVVNQCLASLRDGGQLSELPQPSDVLDLLANHHLLLRSSDAIGSVSFQHQQIQEWYASFEVENQIRATVLGETTQLRPDILNIPAWEEAICFAVERLSRGDLEGYQAAAFTISEALHVDPMLAAELVSRTSEEVWDEVKGRVIPFARRWHKTGTVDRAVRFMITTGRPEFADEIWPLVTNIDDQISLKALRCARQFRPTVLGPELSEVLAESPAKTRGLILQEFIYSGGYNGMEVATTIAKNDQDKNVQVEVLQALDFRRCNRLIRDLLKSLTEEGWVHLVYLDFWPEYLDETSLGRLKQTYDQVLETETDLPRLITLNRRYAFFDPEKSREAILSLVRSPNLPIDFNGIAWTLLELNKRFPKELGQALFDRLEANLEMPTNSEALLASMPVSDSKKIQSLVTNQDAKSESVNVAVGVAGPKTIGTLIDEFLSLAERIAALGGRGAQSLSDRYYNLRDLIGSSRASPFIEAWLARSATVDPIAIERLSGLLGDFGRRGDREYPGEFADDDRKRAADVIEKWVDQLLSTPSATRYQFANLARAIGQIGTPKLLHPLHQLLEEDLRRYRLARNKLKTRSAQSKFADRSDAQISYDRRYQEALISIGGEDTADVCKTYLGDANFELNAAYVLKTIYEQRQGVRQTGKTFRSWPDFSEVSSVTKERRLCSRPLAEEGAPIFAAIDRLLDLGATEAGNSRALQLATVAFSMPYREKRKLIETLLALPVQTASKFRFLCVLILGGEIVSADLVVEGLRAELEAASRETWRWDDFSWKVDQWMQLLVFSDRPAAIVDEFAALPKDVRVPWRFRGLLSVLAVAPTAKSELILCELARLQPEFINEYSWLHALLNRSSPTALKSLFELVSQPDFDSSRVKIDGWSITRNFSIGTAACPELKRDLLRQYKDPSMARWHPAIQRILGHLGGNDVVLAFVEGCENGNSRSFEFLREVLERTALERRAIPDWQNAYEIHGVDVSELRKKLFGIAAAASPQSAAATYCLEFIDKLRDEYGSVDTEPRHPDIRSGHFWPPIVGEC